MSDYERKFGKYAVRDLSLKLIILYLIGYVIYYIRPDILYYMTLNPYAIVHGQVWRLISWLLIPPSASFLLQHRNFAGESLGNMALQCVHLHRYPSDDRVRFFVDGLHIPYRKRRRAGADRGRELFWLLFCRLLYILYKYGNLFRLRADIPGGDSPSVLHHPGQGKMAWPSGRGLSAV